jgi:hypothetical protein
MTTTSALAAAGRWPSPAAVAVHETPASGLEKTASIHRHV